MPQTPRDTLISQPRPISLTQPGKKRAAEIGGP